MKKLQVKNKVKNNSTPNLFKQKYSSKELFVFIILIVLFVASLLLQNNIINYPNNFSFYLYIIILTILAIKYYKLILEVIAINQGINKIIGMSFLLITGIITSIFYSQIIILVLNIYLTYECKKNPIIKVKCNISQVINRARDQKIYYYYQGNIQGISNISFKDSKNLTYGYIPIIIANNPKLCDEYKFIAGIRKGIYDTYLLESWTIQKE